MQPCLLYVGTEDGVFVLEFAGGETGRLVGRGLEGNAVRGIAIHPNDPRVTYVACGLRGWGLHRTRDAGRSFERLGFADRWVWDVAFQPGDPRTLWVGTEPPMLYVTRDDGRTFRALEGIERLPSRARWKFFHPPFYAGHVHGVAIHPARPRRLFAGVEHGALIYTCDGGETWHETLVDHDLHRVAVDPADPDRVFAGAGEGLFISEDAGTAWTAPAALRGKYVHAVAFDPRAPERVYVYVDADGAPLYRSDDGGRTWRGIGIGLPAARPADTLALHPGDGRILFYAGDLGKGRSRVFVSPDAGETWRPLAPDLPKTWRLRAAPPPAA